MKNNRVLIIIAIIIMITGCGTDKNILQNATVVFSVGDVKTLDQSGNKRDVAQGDTLAIGTYVKTGDNSQCAVQMGNTAIVKILNNTTIKVEKLFDDGIDTLYLKKGKILSKVKKLRKDHEFNIRTETSLAAVRGTTFSVSYYPGKNIVAVSQGRVEVTRIEKEEGKIAESGEAIVITDTLQSRKTSEIEELELEKVESIDFIKSREELKSEKGVTLEESIKDRNKDIDQKINELEKKLAPKTLSEIKERYDRIDEITLYSGKIHRGVILSRGKNFKILTTSGTVAVPKNKIKRTRIVE
ncbi:MAG: FecR family protein [Spirochaetota bacterium]